MLRSDRKRKQPESIYRLQEADYDKMKSLRLVRAAASNRVVDAAAAAAVNDLEEDDLAKRQHPPQGKVSRPSDPDSSFKSSRRTGSNNDNNKFNPSTPHPRSSSGHSHRCRQIDQQRAKRCQGNGTTKLGTMAQRFVDLLQAQPNGSILFLDATALLGFTSRRLYDIVHVLDGAGLITIERSRFNSTITWTGGSKDKKAHHHHHRRPPLVQQSNINQDRKLEEELVKLDAWIEALNQPYLLSEKDDQSSANCCNITPTTTTTTTTKTTPPPHHTTTIDQARLYVTKNDLWQQRKGIGGVDLILASQPGSVLQVPTQQTAMTPTSSTPTPSTYSFQLVPPPQPALLDVSSSPVMAYFLEESGILKPLELGVPPPPLLTSCCSDFSLVHLATTAAAVSDTLLRS